MSVCVFLDVSLTVPEDAIMFEAQRQRHQLQRQVFVGVTRDDTDRPKLTGWFTPPLLYCIS